MSKPTPSGTSSRSSPSAMFPNLPRTAQRHVHVYHITTLDRPANQAHHRHVGPFLRTEVIAMSDTTSTRAWTRWQDWAEVVLGVVAVLSPLWLTTTATITWTMIVLGALI